MSKTDTQHVEKWIKENLTKNLDTLSVEDARMWHRLAEDETWSFLRLSESAFRLRRQLLHLPSPVSRKEVLAFQLEFRVKIQIVGDGFRDLPSVPLFDINGHTLYRSRSFKMASLLYAPTGGRS